jgi:hypothetical protein
LATKNRRSGRNPAPVACKKKPELNGFCDFSGLDATGTNFHSLIAALGSLHTNGLQIRIKPARRPIISVGNIISELRAFTANFATFSHDFYEPPKLLLAASNKTE